LSSNTKKHVRSKISDGRAGSSTQRAKCHIRGRNVNRNYHVGLPFAERIWSQLASGHLICPVLLPTAFLLKCPNSCFWPSAKPYSESVFHLRLNYHLFIAHLYAAINAETISPSLSWTIPHAFTLPSKKFPLISNLGLHLLILFVHLGYWAAARKKHWTTHCYLDMLEVFFSIFTEKFIFTPLNSS